MALPIDNVLRQIEGISDRSVYGEVTGVQGLILEVNGIERSLSIGSRVGVEAKDGRMIRCEAVGFRDGRAQIMPFGNTDGIGLGSRAVLASRQEFAKPDGRWLGRVINALGDPVDGGPGLPQGPADYRIRGTPPPAHSRKRVGGKLDLGVRAVNTFTTCCQGQRMGVFSGSGVGKSVMLSQFARFTNADIIVIGLVGERGREVQEFLEDHLGPDGLARSVVVVATSDEAPLMRRQAAHMTLTIAEYFRDQGHQVLCLIDSVTRFAMSLREIGLSVGEPPANKGYPPSVFAELPRLLERAGPGVEDGSITGLFTVLVEGDDMNEPISDAVRGILDGHVVLDRTIAERGRFPAVNPLRSISRMLPDCNTPEENAIVNRAKSLMAAYDEMSELIRIGAYRKGSDPLIDEAIRLQPALEDFMRQGVKEQAPLEQGYQMLAEILEGNNDAGRAAE